MIKTNEIYNELKKSVFGQDEYLKALAVTGYKHQLKKQLLEKGKTPINSNLLVIGPSGCGKTFSVKLLSKLLNVGFYEINCSNLVQVGYRGGQDIEKAMSSMFSKLKKDSLNAIVYLDEFDKILDKYLLGEYGDTASQQNFLKYLEPNELPLTTSSGRSESSVPFDTSGLTFIATGSFEAVKKNIKKEKASKMGFNADDEDINSVKLSEDDLIKDGFMPELIGRFSKLININQLTKEDFVNIVKKGTNSELESYKAVFDMKNIKLDIDGKVYEEIARKAYNTATGARNISKVLNGILDTCLSDVSNDCTISSIRIVNDKGKVKPVYEHDPSRTEIDEEEQEKEDTRIIKVSEYRNVVSKYIEGLNLKIRFYNSLKKGFVHLFDEYGDEVKYSIFSNTLNTRKKAVDSLLENTAKSSVDAEEFNLEIKVYNYLLDKFSNEYVEEKEVL